MRIIFVTLVVFLSACVTYSYHARGIHTSLAVKQPETALLQLDTQTRKPQDHALYNLNKGMLLSMMGRYTESNEFFEIAKNEMRRLEAISIIENIGAVTVNDTLASYPGRAYEKLLLHAYMAMNYLALSRLDDARVEILQANAKMQEWHASDKVEGIKASAFVRYLSGLIFETNAEMDDALIAYRKAYETYKESSRDAPLYLKKDLLRLTKYLDLHNEHKLYRKLFAINDWASMDKLSAYGECIYILHDGLVKPMRQHVIRAYSIDMRKHVHIALPYYPLNDYKGWIPPRTSYLMINNHSYQTEVAEDITQLAHNDLELRMPGITLRALARFAVKKKAVKKVEKKSDFFGFLVDVASQVSETADTRSWSTLPSSIQIVKVQLPPGMYQVGISNSGKYIETEIIAGKKVFIFDHTVSNNLSITRH